LFLRLVVLRTRMLQGTRNRPVVYEISLFSPNEYRFILVRQVYATGYLHTSVFLPQAEKLLNGALGALLTTWGQNGRCADSSSTWIVGWRLVRTIIFWFKQGASLSRWPISISSVVTF
jgi:hypothetical protein